MIVENRLEKLGESKGSRDGELSEWYCYQNRMRESKRLSPSVGGLIAIKWISGTAPPMTQTLSTPSAAPALASFSVMPAEQPPLAQSQRLTPTG